MIRNGSFWIKTIFCFILFFISCNKEEIVDLTIFIPSDNMSELSEEEYELFERVNIFRQDNRKNRLVSDSYLYNLAEIRNDANKLLDTISHDDIGIIIAKAHEYELIISENLGFNYTKPETVMNAWLNSEGHRNNILGNWSHTGLAVSRDEEGFIYYCQIFARRQ